MGVTRRNRVDYRVFRNEVKDGKVVSEMDVGIVKELIGSYGFPIFITVWLLVKSSKENEATRQSMNALQQAVTELTTSLKK